MSDPRGTYNEATSWTLDEDESRLGREWLGYGSLDTPYWFIGPEPGGFYDPLFARFWIDSLGAAPVFDPRRDARAEKNKWFLPTAYPQPTWRPLIEAVLGFTGAEDGVLDHQLHRFGYPPPLGEIAAMKLSAFAARGLYSPSPHRFTFLRERMTAISAALTTGKNPPVFAVFYGKSQSAAYSEIVDGFGTDGFKWVGKTLCALVQHPRAHGPRRDWRKLGGELCHRIKAAI